MTDVNTLVTIVSCAITAIVLGYKYLSRIPAVQKLEASSMALVSGLEARATSDSQALTTAIENELARLHTELASYGSLAEQDVSNAYKSGYAAVLAEVTKLNNALAAAHAKAVADVNTAKTDVANVETAAKVGVAAAEASLSGAAPVTGGQGG